MTRQDVRRRVAGRLSMALVAVAAFATVAVGGGTKAAIASPTDPMTSSVIKLCTGADDKRQDSRVTLDIDTTNGTVQIVLSPDHQNIRLADNTCTLIPVNLFPIVPTDITGFRLEWLRGTTDNTSPDSWWFTGLSITGLNTSFEAVELIDAIGTMHKFEADETLPLVGQTALRGSFDGTVTPPNQPPASIHVAFVSFGGLVSGTATLPGILLLNVCNVDIAIPPVTVTLSGQRDFVDASGASHYTLTAPLPIMNFVVTLKATLTVSSDGQHVDGTLTIEDLPWPCGGPTVIVRLDKTRGR